jgi:hypothetical protein
VTSTGPEVGERARQGSGGGGAIAGGKRAGGEAGENFPRGMARRDRFEQGSGGGGVAVRQARGGQGEGQVLVAAGETIGTFQPPAGISRRACVRRCQPGVRGLLGFVFLAICYVEPSGA